MNYGFSSMKKRMLQASTAGIALMLAAPASAQEAAPAAAAEASNAGPMLGEIIVTARKRGENLVDVPVAITAMTGDGLAARGVQGLNDLNAFVPGLRYQNSAANRNDRSFTTITMRGMYPGDSPNRQAVTIFVDGVAIPGGSTSGLTDIERVEVVKGPQSANFGRATFGGAINFITRAPSTEEVKGSVDLSYESYNSIDVKASVEGPLVEDKLGVRLSGRYYHTDGQYENVGFSGKLGERDTRQVAASFVAHPTDALTVRGYATYWEDSDGPTAQALLGEESYNCNLGGNGRVPTGSDTGFNHICGKVKFDKSKMSQNIVPGGTPNFGGVVAAQDILPADFIDHLGVERQAYQTMLMGDYEFANGYTLSGSFGHNGNKWAALTDTYNRADDTGYHSIVLLPYDIKNTSAELRLSSDSDGPFSYMFGGNYYNESVKFHTKAFRPNVGVMNLGSPTDYRAETFGVFGSASYELAEGLKLNGEARYQWDTINHVVMLPGGADLEKTFKSFSPRVILNYEVTRDISAYASWSKGTRPGTFNSNFVAFNNDIQQQIIENAGRDIPVAVDEEKLTMYELGVKGDFFDRRLRLMTAFYYGEWRDRQINQNIAYTNGSTVSTATITFPEGSTNLWGVEIEGGFQATDNLSFDATFNWAKTDIRFTNCSECLAIDGVANPVGNRMERYPEFSGSFAATYTQPINENWDGMVRMDYVYTGKQYATSSNVTYIGDAHKVNLRAGVNNETYTLEFFVKNLFNEKTPSNLLRNTNPNGSAAQGLNTIVLAAPERRTIGVRGVVKF